MNSSQEDEITFTEQDILEHRNTFAKLDGRALPKYGKGPKFRTGKCRVCGTRCWPYSTCKLHREWRTLHRTLLSLQKSGDVQRLTDGRGTKGGATWQATKEAKERWDSEKKARTFRRESPKIGRNEPCSCGSGKKFKHCHGSSDSASTNEEIK